MFLCVQESRDGTGWGIPSYREGSSNASRPARVCSATPESLYAEVPNLDVATATKIAKDRIEWKRLRKSKRC